MLKRFVYLAVIWSAPLPSAWGWEDELCGRFRLHGPNSVDLTANEKTLLCGDKDVKEWRVITDSQSLFHLKTFLENRGYFGIKTREEGKWIAVDIPEKTRVKKWNLRGAPDIDASRFRNIVGEPLTPSLLDSTTDRITLALENKGYGCPSVKTEADAVTGAVWTTADPSTKKNIGSIKRELIEGRHDETLSRYDAFLVGGPYRRDLLRLTELRITSDNILQSTHFEVECIGDEVHLKQKNVAGPPRLFIVGVGVNTQQGPSAKVTWKHLRLGRRASNVSLALTSSFKVQRFDAISDWYFWEDLNRFHLMPSASVSHEAESTYERYKGELRLTPATSWDGEDVGLKASFGPTLNIERNISGPGPRDAKFMAISAVVLLMSHTYELNQGSPYKGYEVLVDHTTAMKSAFSPATASKTEIRGTYLWNLFGWEPPGIVLGIRGAAAVTMTDEDLQATSLLPSSFRLRLGGSRDLRGFARLVLPEGGALSTAFLSAEIRFAGLLPYSLQPIAFIDVGKTGSRPFSLERKTYWSPGLGARLQSPIGVFRVTVARGIVSGDPAAPPAEWLPYFSYGEEF